MTIDLDKDTQKRIVKEAISEWLDVQLMHFGAWSLKGLAAIAISAMLYAWLSTHGFKM